MTVTNARPKDPVLAAAHWFQSPVDHGIIRRGHITIYTDLIQGTDEWFEARRGMLTASEMKLILTSTLKVANNEKTRAHVWELLAQRISGFVEPSYVGDDMLRGYEDEIEARRLYSEKIAPVEEIGFITNERLGFRIGCSPDGLVGDDGAVEFKSRRQKFQVETIVSGEPPSEHMIQLQTTLLVTERTWIDYGSYSGGLPMVLYRVYPDDEIQSAIIEAAGAFEERVTELRASYDAALKSGARLLPTTRRLEQEMHI